MQSSLCNSGICHRGRTSTISSLYKVISFKWVFPFSELLSCVSGGGAVGRDGDHSNGNTLGEKMKKIKVLQLQPDYNVKAHEFADLAEQVVMALPTERYEVTSAFLSGKPKEGDPESKAARSVYFEFSTGNLKGLRIKALWHLYRLCKEEQYDVIICNRFKPISMMLLLGRWLHIPLCIGIVHGFGDFDRQYRQRQVKRLVRDNWRFVGVSQAVKQHLLDYRCGFTEKNTCAITNAIDVEQARALLLPREEARRELGLDHQAVIVGALGRLVTVKGHRFLIEAFARLKDKHPNTQLAIIGEGRERGALEELVKQLGVSDRVFLPGFKADALRYACAFDVWVMPSLAEGLGLALLEGMCGRLPVIASDVPAMRPLVMGAGGIAVPPGDVPALTDALDEYLSLSDEEREAKGEKAFQYLLREHSIDAYRQEYLNLIESAGSIQCD